MALSVKQLVDIIGGVVKHGDTAVGIEGVEAIERATAGQLAFVANRKYASYLKTTAASAVIIPDEEEFYADASASTPVLIAHPQPYFAFMLALRHFHPDDLGITPGVDPTAAVGEEVKLGDDVHLGKNVVVEDGATIGAGSKILAGSYVGRAVTIGEKSTIGPNVTVLTRRTRGNRVRIHPGTVIGADGFGYAEQHGVHHKIPQVGRVVIGDDVEIGACVCIDRATMGETRIGNGTKIDNLVQLAHNVEIGEHSLVVSQVGVSGSTKIGRHVILAGQAGLIGHLRIGDNVIVAAQAGVGHDLPEGARVLGSPAREIGLSKRLHVYTGRLPEMAKKIKELEKRLKVLEKGR